MTGVNDIRRAFLDFFAKQGHEVVPSAPLVPLNDPTLMFTNAGMVPFKNVFTGQEQRDYVRAVSSQKCVRAGGKHNDLDNVGYTARHHTFFEMLGNFSFGDYFKDEAIALAWRLITKEFDVDPKRLLVTVYHDDDQAFDLWKKVTGFDDSKIIRIATSDNFWSMGATGPCGPSSEIFFDHNPDNDPKGPQGGPPGSDDEDGNRFVEIWNLVFMQFDQQGGGKRVDLPKPSIDTGMGLERIAAVLQGTYDNYEIDLFQNLIDDIKAKSLAVGGVDFDDMSEGNLDPKLDATLPTGFEGKIAYRVIADHLRSTTFLIADGVLPSNEGRGYVLRRIMRRAMRYAHQLGCKEPLMHLLVPKLVSEMGAAFPELVRGKALIEETLKLEETRFKATLTKGLGLLETAIDDLKGGDTLPGDVAFKLYDTFGFPLDLTQDALRRRDLKVDTDGFDTAMAKQKAEARKAWKGSGDQATEEVWFDIKEESGATEFLGYETLAADGEIVALVKNGKAVKSLKAGDEGSVVVNQTPFYGEAGGQIGDKGQITRGRKTSFQVTDTQKKLGGLYVHHGTLEAGGLKAGDTVTMTVDEDRRQAMRANHSATHLLHEALRQVLGSHVAQKGSLVAPDRLRFDFSHPKPIAGAELSEIESLANQVVSENAPVETHLMSYDDALATGAMALFGEKYGDEVRVVSMGAPTTNRDGKKSAWSIELCGGTHVARTGDIGLIRIVAETASAAGVRRLEALTGDGARNHLIEQDERVKALAGFLKTKPDDLIDRVRALSDERKSLERALSDAKKQAALGGSNASANGAVDIAGTKLLKLSVSDVASKDLKAMADEARSSLGSGIVAVANAANDGKLGIVVTVSADLTKTFSAIDLVRAASASVGGKGGGGRPDMAQAGGPDGKQADQALTAIEEAIKSNV